MNDTEVTFDWANKCQTDWMVLHASRAVLAGMRHFFSISQKLTGKYFHWSVSIDELHKLDKYIGCNTINRQHSHYEYHRFHILFDWLLANNRF